MKLLMAVYNVAMDKDVMDALEAIGVHCFTKWPRVLGRGRKTGPRMDTHVWPGANTVTMFVMEDDMAKKAMKVIKDLREKMGHEGVKAFLLNVEDKL